MSDLDISVDISTDDLETVRPLLDAALHKQFPGGLLQRRWDGDALELSGPGAAGSIVLADGALQGSATLKPPASLMKPVIEQKIGDALREVAAAVSSTD